MGNISWKSELSLLDEHFERDPRHPLATKIEHQAYEFHKQNELLENLSSDQKKELRDTTSAICGSLENGFSELYEVNIKGFESITSAINQGRVEMADQFGKVNRNLEKINATLSWGFSALIEQLTLTNRKLDQVINLLNIPDSQKQRKYHIEQGFEFLKKSRITPLFYDKARQNFEDAVSIEDADYLSLQQLGIIHLYSNNLLDLELSEKYFKQSILFSSSDINFAKNQQSPSSFQFSYNPAKITATSLLHLARVYYNGGDCEKAFEIAKRAGEIYKMVGIYFDLSKYACELNNKEDALFFLEEAISMDRYIAVKTLNEAVLICNKYITDFLKTQEKIVSDFAKENLQELKSTKLKSSIYDDEILIIEELVNKNNYLDSLHALEKIGYELEN